MKLNPIRIGIRDRSLMIMGAAMRRDARRLAEFMREFGQIRARSRVST